MEDAVGYLRVSTSKQEANYSKPDQLKSIREYANEQNRALIEIFEDTISGLKTDRPGLLEMRAFIMKRKQDSKPIRYIYVYHQDRLARDLYPILDVEHTFELLGCKFLYASNKFSDDDAGETLKLFSGVMSGMERKAILRRSVLGKLSRAQAGFVLISGISPYGYSYVKEHRKGELVIRESEARIVRLIYKWYVHGLDQDEVELNFEANHPVTLRGIVSLLFLKRIPTRLNTDGPGSTPVNTRRVGVPTYAEWSISVVRRILINRTYMGEWIYGKTGSTVKTPVVVKVPAIVTKLMFDSAAARISHNKIYSKRNTIYEYMMRSRITCECGRGMGVTVHGHKKSSYRLYYKCYSYKVVHGLENNCKKGTRRADDIDERVQSAITNMVENPQGFIAGFRELEAADKRNNDIIGTVVGSLTKRIEQLEEQSDRLLDQVTQGVFTATQIERKNKTLVEDINKLKAEREAEQAKVLAIVADTHLRSFEATCKEISKGIAHATFEDWLQYMALLDVHVIANFDDSLYITVSLNGKPICVTEEGKMSI